MREPPLNHDNHSHSQSIIIERIILGLLFTIGVGMCAYSIGISAYQSIHPKLHNNVVLKLTYDMSFIIGVIGVVMILCAGFLGHLGVGQRVTKEVGFDSKTSSDYLSVGSV